MKKIHYLSVLILFFSSYLYAGQSSRIVVRQTKPFFTIDLPANATTGYRWAVGLHDPAIHVVGSSYFPYHHPAGMVGVGGHTVFQFKVASRAFLDHHPMSVQMVYEQPWNPGVDATKRYFSVVAITHN